MPITADAAFSISQFRDAWRVLCAACPETKVAAADGVEYIFSGLPVAFFNVAIVTGDQVTGDELAAHGRRAREWASSAHVPWLFIVTHDTLTPDVDAAVVLGATGLVPMLPMTGMIAHRINPPARVPAGLAVDVARDDESCVAALDINAAAYAADLDATKPIYGKRSTWDPHVLALGHAAGAPAASAAVMLAGGYRYVALVATLPDHQRRGYAEAVMRHALEVSLDKYGDRPTTLHATDAGRPIYARMGYEPIARHTAFIDQAFLHG